MNSLPFFMTLAMDPTASITVRRVVAAVALNSDPATREELLYCLTLNDEFTMDEYREFLPVETLTEFRRPTLLKALVSPVCPVETLTRFTVHPDEEIVSVAFYALNEARLQFLEQFPEDFTDTINGYTDMSVEAQVDAVLEGFTITDPY